MTTDHSSEKDKREDTAKAFAAVVNMTPAALEKWLATEESRAVGFKHEGESEAVGHAEGRRIIAIKQTAKTDLSEADFVHMRKVVGYVHRHLAQGGPADKDEVETSRWRYSLMNWGHDPMKD